MAHALGEPAWGGRRPHSPLLLNSQALLLARLPTWRCFVCAFYSFPIQRGFIDRLCTQFRGWGVGRAEQAVLGT